MTGYVAMTVNEHSSTTTSLLPGQNPISTSVYRFAMNDVPAFRDEVYITAKDDYLAKIDFELARYQLPGTVSVNSKNLSVSWEALDNTLLSSNDFGGQIKRASFLRETAKTLLTGSADTLSRVKAAYDYVRQTVKWNEETALWSAEGIKKAIDNRKGNAADINLLLIALLREMNIDANPLILSTRSHGRINESYALLKKFNYIIAHVSVSGKDLLLDATDAYLPPGMLPVHCLNGTGRLVHPTKPRFVSLLPVERDVEAYLGTFSISDNGEVAGTLTHSHGGYSAWSNRKQFVSEGKAKYLASVQKKRPAWQIENADFSGLEGHNSTFSANYTLAVPEACAKAGDRLYLLPMLTEAHGVNPFKEPQRLYPVDLGVPIDESFVFTYTLPEGYQVEELPQSVSMQLPQDGGRFLYQVAVNAANRLQVNCRISLRRPLYLSDEYGSLRELFNRIIAKHAEQVVLKRGTVAEKK